MAIKRMVSTAFWTDTKVLDMFSPEDKLFMLYLLTNPHTTQLGIYQIHPKHISFEIGYTLDSIKVLLDRFEDKYEIIKYSDETKEIAIKNFLRHGIIKGGAPVRDCLVKELRAVKDKSLIEFVFSHLKQYDDLNETVKGIIVEYEKTHGEISYSNEKRKSNKKKKDIDNEKDNDNENDNDNDISYPVSYNDSLNDTQKTRKNQSNHSFGEFQNVFLSDDELSKLKAEFPDYEKRIERLSAYMNSTGKTYKNHYSTIKSWALKEEKKQPKHAGSNIFLELLHEMGVEE